MIELLDLEVKLAKSILKLKGTNLVKEYEGIIERLDNSVEITNAEK